MPYARSSGITRVRCTSLISVPTNSTQATGVTETPGIVDLPRCHARSQMSLSQGFAEKIDHRCLLFLGNPAGKKIYIDTGRSQSPRCLMKVELAEPSRNDCAQTLLFDVHSRLVIVVVRPAVVLRVV